MALLVLPSLAILRSGAEAWKVVAVVMAAMSVMTYLFYASDKSRAIRKAWRVPEAQLHLLELLGGWHREA